MRAWWHVLIGITIVAATAPLFPEDHENVTYLTDDNFDSTVLQSDMSWIVNFYSPSCWHCKVFASSFEEIAAFFKPKIRVGAISCLDHVLCRKLEINGYPHLVFYNFKVHGENRRLGGNVKPSAIYAMVEELENREIPIETTTAPSTTPRPIWTASPETSTHLTRLHDAAVAIIHGFKYEMFAGSESMSPDELAALKQWLDVLAKTFPGAHNRAALKKLLEEVLPLDTLTVDAWHSFVDSWKAKGVSTPRYANETWQKQPQLFDGDGKTFQVCEGYACGLWTLIHLIAHQTNATTDCVEVYGAIRGFVEHFMTCKTCQGHFLQANPRHLQTKTPVALQLWAHRTHNAVNERVRHPQFPSPSDCLRCGTDMSALLRFLDERYGYPEVIDIQVETESHLNSVPWYFIVLGIGSAALWMKCIEKKKRHLVLDKDRVV
ncbi:hypothetical protein LEN26_006129 [Aphanomyces euteiches]|nr:hypothetical protein AeMF1_015000 [Aphanomyces euteiches]KAH9136557.1 hypothetical protein LEN26_006129 [Aphanomyces euteiches]KAH9194261.1 hypothetical protein AeNC1_003773 [Aphanomyces euteiches]